MRKEERRENGSEKERKESRRQNEEPFDRCCHQMSYFTVRFLFFIFDVITEEIST